MDDFVKAMAPYLAANLLTVAVVYSLIKYDRLRQSGQHVTGAAFTRFVYIVLCLAILAYGLALHGAFESSPFSHFVGDVGL